jgi:hypothetical protein
VCMCESVFIDSVFREKKNGSERKWLCEVSYVVCAKLFFSLTIFWQASSYMDCLPGPPASVTTTTRKRKFRENRKLMKLAKTDMKIVCDG